MRQPPGVQETDHQQQSVLVWYRGHPYFIQTLQRSLRNEGVQLTWVRRRVVSRRLRGVPRGVVAVDPGDVAEFVGLAVASGVLGNATYDGLKAIVRRGVETFNKRGNTVGVPARAEAVEAPLDDALLNDSSFERVEEGEPPHN